MDSQQLLTGNEEKHKRVYRADIDGLRGIAVMAVLLYHLDIPWIEGGYTGVDVFLVISGFLITGIIRRECLNTGKFDFKNFYVRRIRRLFPALFFMLVLSFLGAALFFSPTMLMQFAESVPYAIFSLSNVHFYISTDYFNETIKLEPLLHTWSLSVEEQFYIFWPLLLFVLYKAGKKWLIFTTLLLLGLLSFAINPIFGHEWFGYIGIDGRAAIFYLLPFRIFEFVIGAALVWIPAVKNQILNTVGFLVGLALVLVAAFTFTELMIFPSYYALVPCVGAALMIWSGQGTVVAPMVTNHVLVYLGKISYSLYLLHWPLTVYWKYTVGVLEWADWIWITVISIAISSVSYHFVEQPFRLKKLKLFSWRYGVTSLAGLVIMLCLGAHILLNKGWQWRVSSDVAMDYIDNPATFNIDYYGGRALPDRGYEGPVNTDEPADIVLMGDSHGRQYTEGLYELVAKPNDLSLYTSPGWGVLMLPGPYLDARGGRWIRDRQEKLDQAMGYIKAGDSPIVVVAHAWVIKLGADHIFASEEMNSTRKLTMDDLVEGILRLKADIGESELVIIGQVPATRGVDVYDRLSRPAWLKMWQDQADDPRFTVPDPHYQQINASLKAAAEETGKFTFLDPFDALLDDSGRSMNLDHKGRFIYTDTHHLSIYGSKAVIQQFLPEFKELLERRERRLNPDIANTQVQPDSGMASLE